MGRLTQKILGISPREVSFSRRGFRGAAQPAREPLEEVARAFVSGYNTALIEMRPGDLDHRLQNAVRQELWGFAFEGAAMALTLVDCLTPFTRSRLRALLDGPGRPHTYLVHVGAGWVLGRVPMGVDSLLKRLDPLLGWLALDGYGFHQGFFHWRQAVDGGEVPRRLRGYARRAFDQGLGRSLWFVEGAHVDGIVAAISSCAPRRRPDLWSGVGLAAAYAGAVGRREIEALGQAAADYLPEVAQGAAFAAQARRRGGNPAAHTELACRVLCRRSAEEAARVTENALVGLDLDGATSGPRGTAGSPPAVEPAFETWRRRIRDRFVEQGGPACSNSTDSSVATG